MKVDKFIFEDELENVKNKRTQEYLQEVLSTYYNHEYRSCIVILYAVTFTDFLDKFNTLAELYDDKESQDFLSQYKEKRENDSTLYSALEKDVKEFAKKKGMLSDVELKQWERLKEYRDYCAHPVVGSEFELISPSSEQVRAHIRNMFEAIFLKDAIITKKIFEEFLSNIKSFYDRNGVEEFEEYIEARYISRLNAKAKRDFVKNLWKLAFYIDEDEENKYRAIYYRALILIIKSDKDEILDFMGEQAAFFNGHIRYEQIIVEKADKDIKVYDYCAVSLLFTMFSIPELGEIISDDNKIQLGQVAHKNVNYLLLARALYNSEEEHVRDIIDNLTGLNFCFSNNLLLLLWKNRVMSSSYNDLIICYFFNCMGSSRFNPDYDYINWTYTGIVSKALPTFSEEQLCNLLRRISYSYISANIFTSMKKQILNLVTEKGYNIDYSEYDIDITKYGD